MKINRLTFSIDIKADKTKIWEALWEDHSYREWISVFAEGSYVVAKDWKVSSKVFFLGADQSGIFSVIEKHIPNKVIQFKHIGIVTNGKEQPLDDETKTWSGATETYSISEEENQNTLTVEIDILDEHLDFMRDAFPKALEKMKALALSL